MAAAPPFRRFLANAILVGIACVLFATRPRFDASLHGGGVDPGTKSCLSNLAQIGRAYALYAHDYDGKIPRGVDPIDRFDLNSPFAWRLSSDGLYDPAKTPYLHEILRPYVASPRVFRCPSDNGWVQTRVTQLDRAGNEIPLPLQNVHPSSFARFGTSYYCWTQFGFDLNTADDIENPGQQLLLFDGDMWHTNLGRELMNGLFADGHVQNLTIAQYRGFSH